LALLSCADHHHRSWPSWRRGRTLPDRVRVAGPRLAVSDDRFVAHTC